MQNNVQKKKTKQTFTSFLIFFIYFFGGGGFIGQLERIMKAKIWAQGEEFRRKDANQSQGSLASFRWSNLIIETGTLALMMQWLLTLKKVLPCVRPCSRLFQTWFFWDFLLCGTETAAAHKYSQSCSWISRDKM